MNRRFALATALCAALTAAGLLSGCATGSANDGWVTLIDGDKGLDNWAQVGDANWRAEGGVIVADKGRAGFLLSRLSFKDVLIRAEFWAATDTNSGVFLRVSDPKTITADNAYEVNIWDIRPDPKYGTAAIVNQVAVPVPPVYLAGGQWNTFEIEARGTKITVKFNGATTAVMDNAKLLEGPFALQFGPGVQGVLGGPIKWRKVQVKAL